MEKLKVPNPAASDLGEQLGIPIERREFLSIKMDLLVRGYNSGGMRIVTLPSMLVDIQEYCNTQEEFTWCICNHMAWLYKTGRILSK